MSDVRHIKISKDEDGQRMDRWLKKYLPGLPFSYLQKLMRTGQVRLDSKRVQSSTRVAHGQSVRLPPVPDEMLSKNKDNARLSDKDKQLMQSLVIFDDGDVIAINKPYGLASQGGSKTKKHIDGMLDALTNKDGVRPRLVHRLDKDTSGVMLLARSAKVAQQLGDIFKHKQAKKIYWALVSPSPSIPDGSIKAPLIKAGGSNKEKMVVDEQEGKFALTEYRVLEDAAGQAAFVAFWPRTGRTHQIRVHAQVIESPILGDFKYGDPDHQIEGVKIERRLHLHARRLICPHPVKRNAIIDVSAPLPDDLKKSWKALGFHFDHADDPFDDLDA